MYSFKVGDMVHGCQCDGRFSVWSDGLIKGRVTYVDSDNCVCVLHLENDKHPEMCGEAWWVQSMYLKPYVHSCEISLPSFA